MGCVLALVLPTGESWFVLECCGLVGFRVVDISLSLLLSLWRALYTSLCTLMRLFASAL